MNEKRFDSCEQLEATIFKALEEFKRLMLEHGPNRFRREESKWYKTLWGTRCAGIWVCFRVYGWIGLNKVYFAFGPCIEREFNVVEESIPVLLSDDVAVEREVVSLIAYFYFRFYLGGENSMIKIYK